MRSIDQLKRKLIETMTRDRFGLSRRLQQLQQERAPRAEHLRKLAQLEREFDASVAMRCSRAGSLPEIQCDASLPIATRQEEIQRALRERQVVVVAGETGSGKSTQLPKLALAAGYGIGGMIGHTQPRRIAARSVASRIAEEMNVELGAEVGFKIRFTDKSHPRTLIKLMTDGILLAETQSDRFLEEYEVIILDEAHERSLNIDFLIGYLKRILPKRPELRLIITSATIDVERFSQHFDDERGPAPIIEVSGRSFPVEIRYRPLIDDDDEPREIVDGLVDAAHELAAINRGNMLVFLPTERDIREVAGRLRAETFPGDGSRKTEILPLYARLSAAEQNRIFRPSNYRRIILSTNVAESSLTVPDVRYVIDTGTARISRYSPRSKVQRLPIEAVSRASADQRAGRCGRVAPGICIRLYGEDEFERRDAYTTPEIRRTHLASVILQAKSLRLGDVEEIPFLDPPRPEAVRDGYKTLFEIGAVDAQRRLTPVGRELARMPVDPRIGRMILAAKSEGCLSEILIIAAALEIQDPRERPHDKQQQADQRHERFLDNQSDFLSYLKLWDFYHELRQAVSRSKLRKVCRQHYLSFNRLREWTEIQRQLLEIIGRRTLRLNPRRDDFASIHRALLAGLLSGVAMKSGEREYTGAFGVQLTLWPGSGLGKNRPQWLVSAELVETSRRFARTVARISPTWVEPLADHLVKRSHSDPHWHRKSNTVMAYEKVSLFGLPVVTKRRVPYGTINPKESRQIFIEAALVQQRTDIRDRFFQNNCKVRDEVAELAAKTRCRDYLLDDYTIYAFYDQRLPEDVYDIASLRRWFKASRSNAAHLFMSRDDLVDTMNLTEYTESFPDHLSVGSMKLPVSYNFQLDASDDGVTITVPTPALGQLTDRRMGWLVPGLLEEKVVALIRSLPKPLRRDFVPVPDTAKQIMTEIEFGHGDLLQSLAGVLTRRSDQVVRADDFDLGKLPKHLSINVRVVDEDGQEQKSGRDLDELQMQLRASTDDQHAVITDVKWTRDEMTNWDFDDLPAEVQVDRGGIAISAYPGLVDRTAHVSLRLFDNRPTADWSTRRGVARLYALANGKSLRTQVRHLPRLDECCVWAGSVMDSESLKRDLQDRIVDIAFLAKSIPRTKAEFDARMDQAVERIAVATQDVSPLVPAIFEAYHHARLALEGIRSSRHQMARADMENQMAELCSPRFLATVPWFWLQQIPRYLKAIDFRLEKLSGVELRDQQGREQVGEFWSRVVRQRERNAELGRFDPALEEYRWMVEELRVSLFAQSLGTAVKVSPQRLEKQWSKVADAT